jgi:hypothetical protein
MHGDVDKRMCVCMGVSRIKLRRRSNNRKKDKQGRDERGLRSYLAGGRRGGTHKSKEPEKWAVS